MKRPPIISFLTYNRLGNTAISLPSLLRTHDDFELYIIDNASRDDTWEFLNDTKDPRIKHRKKFDDNIGVVHGLNYVLSHRKNDQDFINFEYDYRIHDKNFVKNFRETANTFPEMAAISATIYPAKYEEMKKIIEKKESPSYLKRNDIEVYLDYILGFCLYIPYETMNELGYYNEVDCFGDVELNLRFRGMKKVMGYALDIHVSHSTHGGHCDTCIAYHNPCYGYDIYRNPKCLKYYDTTISKVMDTINMYPRYAVIRQKADNEKIFPKIKCNSIFSNEYMDENEKQDSQHVMDLFKRLTNEYIENMGN
jgi:glycosyltransferase involved in cell wall biosynthesis